MLSRKSKKEISKLLSEFTKNMDKVDKARDKLEPFWTWEIDGVIDDVIKRLISPGQFKYFAACKFKAKALTYINFEIKRWDEKYKKFVDLCIREKSLKYFEEAPSQASYAYCYFPPFEAMEFESLLFQGKACLDCFAKAIGSLFERNPPRKFDSLETVLSSHAKTNQRALKILSIVKKNESRLRGTVLNPIQPKNLKPKKPEKKSIRDLITHYERIPIILPIFKDKKGKMTTSRGAQIIMRHPQMVLLYNYSAVTIAGNVWYYTLEMLKKSLQAAFPEEIKVGHLRKVEELKERDG